MKKQNIVYIILILQGIVSACFALGLFFVLPHQFSEAFNHYVALAPVVRNYYCFTLLITGLAGIYFIFTMIKKIKYHRAMQFLSGLIAVCILYGLLIFPLVEMFYLSSDGLVSQTVEVYRTALMNFNIYLTLHASIALYCGYCWGVKQPRKKHAAIVSVVLVVLSVCSGTMIYQKYYENQKINLTENLKYRFVGVNGSGFVEVVDNPMTTQNIYSSFYDSLNYEILNNGSLSNGEQVAITVTYDQELAKQLKLEVLDAVEMVKVVGLREFYDTYELVPTIIAEEANQKAKTEVHNKLLELFPGKDTQVSEVATYYIKDNEKTDAPYSFVYLYKIAYTQQEQNYYYYRACHIDNVHSEALKNLELLTPVLSQETYRSSLFEVDETEMSFDEAKVHANAFLTSHYDEVIEIEHINH